MEVGQSLGYDMNARNQQTEYVIKNKGGEQTSCP